MDTKFSILLVMFHFFQGNKHKRISFDMLVHFTLKLQNPDLY